MIPDILGPKLAAIIALPGVTDVLINGHEQVWVQRSAGRLEPVTTPFEAASEIARLAQDLIASGGRHLDQANPFADVSIGGNIRVHAALASTCHPKTLISIRIHLERHFGLQELSKTGMFGTFELELLQGILRNRQNFLIAGAAGAGKTTLLRAMLAECANERIIAIEDVGEIGLDSAHFISLQTRQANNEGAGEITLERLVREALRMRPDRIAVGEVRGAELLTMVQALNTGHAGGGATLHANSFETVASRLSAIGWQCQMPGDEMLTQVRAAIDWVIFLGVQNGARRVLRIGPLS